jgi:Tfp pilus assembly protein PilO
MTLPAAWRVRWWTWALPLAFALLNAVVLVVHPGRTGAGFADMKKELGNETKALAALADKENTAATVLTTARSSRVALAELYDDRFSTEAERLTRLITEVKRLAQLAGLEPASISYPEETLDEYGLVRMSLVFGVEGTYPQLRTLVNLLELSDLFLVLEQVSLRDSAASVLTISLQISTFFVREPLAASSAKLPSDGEAAERSPATEPSPTPDPNRVQGDEQYEYEQELDQHEMTEPTVRSPQS